MKDNIRSRQLIFLFVLISVMVSTIAYAGLSTSLAITSEAKLKAIADIRVNDIKYKESNNGGRQEYEPEYDVKEVKVGVVLPNASSNVIYKVEIINSGDIDQIIKEITVSNPNVNVEINGITIGNSENENIIEAKSTREIEIKITPKTPSNEVQNVVITFNFKKIYKITYDANGGENAPSSQNKIEDEDIMLTNEKPTKVGYDLESWNTKTDGSGTSYPDAQTGMIYKTNANLETINKEDSIDYFNIPQKITSVAFFPDGTKIAIGGEKGKIFVYNTLPKINYSHNFFVAKKKFGIFHGGKKVTNIQFIDKNYAIVSTADSVIRYVHMNKGIIVKQYKGYENKYSMTRAYADLADDVIIVGGEDGNCYAWRIYEKIKEEKNKEYERFKPFAKETVECSIIAHERCYINYMQKILKLTNKILILNIIINATSNGRLEILLNIKEK